MFHLIDKNENIVLRARKINKNRFWIETYDIIDDEAVQITVRLTKKELLKLIDKLKDLTE